MTCSFNTEVKQSFFKKNGHWYLYYPVDMIIVIIIISLVYEMLFIRAFKANLNVQSDSICAKVFNIFYNNFYFL